LRDGLARQWRPDWKGFVRRVIDSDPIDVVVT
jgi:hypothetical protein